MTIYKNTHKDVALVIQTMLNIVFVLTIAIWDNVFWSLVLAPLQIFLLLCCNNTSLHHHCHWLTFNSKKSNQLYECLLSIAGATSAQVYRNIHLIHHRFVNDPPPSRDHISALRHGTNGKPQNIWLFALPWTVMTSFLYIGLTRNYLKMPLVSAKQCKIEIASIAIFFVGLLVINWWYALWWLLVLCPVMQFFNAAWHYGEHYGAYHYRGDTTRDSVGIYNRYYNKLCFNSGLHQEHHYKPGVHWSRLHLISSQLPNDRTLARGMHIFNVPWFVDFKKLFKLSSN